MDTNVERQQLLSELYALKAGLSQLSIEVDKLRAAETAYQEKKQNMEWAQQTIEHKSNQYKSNKELADKQRKELGQYNAARNGRKALGAISLVAALIVLVAGIAAEKVMLSVLVAAALGIFGLAKLFPGTYNTPKGPNIRHMVEFDQFDKRYREEIKKLESEYPAVLAEYNKAKELYDATYADVYPVASALFNALVVRFDGTMRVRDWYLLDLVVHYLDSERADTKKEALLLADRQIQIGAIIAAIEQASAQICQTIRTESDLIRLKMGEHFDALSKQLEKQHRETMGGIAGMKGSVDAVGRRLSEISSTERMNTALLSKIATNSQKLAEDATYIERYNRIA